MATPRGSFPSPGRMEPKRRTASGSQKPGPLFSWFVEQEFSPWSAKTHRSPNTHKRYAVSAKSLVSFFGHLPLSELTSGLVERYKLWRLGQCGFTGVNRDLAALHFMLNFAIRLGYVEDNPVAGVKMLAEPQDRMHVLSHQEEKKYLLAASRTLRDVGVLILGTGMRPAEVLSLKTEDIHLTDRYVFVPKGKTRAARRSLPLTETAYRMLSRRMRGAWCFPSRRSESGHMVNVRKLHQQACRKAELKFRLYDLRHTYGSRAVMAGVDLPTLKEYVRRIQVETRDLPSAWFLSTDEDGSRFSRGQAGPKEDHLVGIATLSRGHFYCWTAGRLTTFMPSVVTDAQMTTHAHPDRPYGNIALPKKRPAESPDFILR